MARALVAALLVVLALCAPAAPQDKVAFVWKPNVISTQIGGAFGQSYEVTFDRRELRYYSAKNMFELGETKAVVVRPTDKQWEAFFDDLDRLDVWSWKGRYDNPGVADGTSWSAVIVYQTQKRRALVSSGSNAYPENFKGYLSAVRKLIGDREFR
jgi:hypothetical protein